MLRLSSEDVHLFTDRPHQIKLIQFGAGANTAAAVAAISRAQNKASKQKLIHRRRAIRTHKDGFETKRAPSQ
jgi:hypothetical protein